MPTPTLDHWTTIFLLFVAQGYLLGLLLRVKGPRANRWLGLYLLCFAITLTDYVGYWSMYNLKFPWLAGIYEPLAFTFGPLLLLYLRDLAEPARKRRADILHFLPFALCLLYNLPLFALNTSSKVALLLGESAVPVEELLFFSHSPFLEAVWICTHLVIYFLLIARMVKWQIPKLENPVQRHWLRSLLALFGLFVLGYLSYYLLIHSPYYLKVYDYGISLAMALSIFWLGILGYLRPEIFSGAWSPRFFTGSKYRHSTLTDSAAASLERALLEHMEKTTPFLDPELRLPTLAEQLHTSPHHLSQVLNSRLGMPFPAFINRYRIRQARQLLSLPEGRDMRILDVAYQSGFNNKTTFYKAFKADTGLSPSQFRARRAPQNQKA